MTARRGLRLLGLIVAVLLIVAGCSGDATQVGDSSTPAAPETAPLTGTTWRLDAIIEEVGRDDSVISEAVGSAQQSPREDPPPTLRLDDDGTLRLFDGCNGIDGRWRLDDVLDAEETFRTDVACPDLESTPWHVVTVFSRPRVEVDGHRMTLVDVARGMAFVYRVE